MTVTRGPSRIVLLRSSVYDYAELEIHEPVHLVAANNVGKTSIISALQFLYIDDARQMHFSHDFTETRRHYFPENGSLLLFECMTPTGFQVFGLRGLGPVQGFEYERFAYNGQYYREDFVVDRKPRTWEDVARRLMGRELRQMDPKHLRASLTGTGDAKGPHLGLVPLKRSGTYESFRFLFRNLLRLSKIEQDQLKRLFIDIARPQLTKIDVDLRKDYAELFHSVERQASEVAALRTVEPLMADLVRLYGERKAIRGRLAAGWRLIEAALESERGRVQAASDAFEEAQEALEEESGRLQREQSSAVREGNRLSEQIGKLDTRLKELEVLRDAACVFVPEIEAALRDQLQTRYDALVARLQSATQAERASVERQLGTLLKELDADRRLAERFGDAIVTWLRNRSGLDDRALNDVFGVLDASLLGEVLGGDRVSLLDDAAAIRLIRGVSEKFDADGFIAGGIRIRRQPVGTRLPLDDYADVEVVKSRIEGLQVEELRLSQLLRDIDERDQLLLDRKRAEVDLRAAHERIKTWESWEARKGELANLKHQLDELGARTAENGALVEEIGKNLQSNAVLRSQGKRAVEDARATLKRQVAEVNRLTPALLEWEPAGEWGIDGLGLDEMVRAYRLEWNRHSELSKRVESLFSDVKHKTAERILGATDDETIDRLQDELAALEKRDQSVRDLWASLVDGMRNAFKALLDSVDAVRKQVSRLTSALGRRQVSNLERVELEMIQQRGLIQRLRAVIEAEDAPLFAGPQGRSRAALDVQKWLEDRPHLDLSELFDLRFTVVDVRGQIKSFDSLAQIESQGTSTTIKVLVHLELLRSMLSEDGVAVPFFLDEVATLDGPNLRALIEHASQMGFVPVVASPEARDCVETLYFLRPGRGRLVLDETSRLRLLREPENAT